MSDSVFGKNSAQQGGPLTWEPKRRTLQNNSKERPANFSKVFRWQPDGQAQPPASVEVAGSFTKWQKVPLALDGALNTWQVTLHNIPAHQTHHYMLLVDGKPVQDKNSDGLAVPRSPQEAQFALQTDRGPRVFMLFAQTK